MELKSNTSIFFDPTSHTYTNEAGDLLIGVTSLMAKHNLGADYSGIPDSVLRKAAEKGTEIHKEIQDYENGETIFASELIDEYKKLALKFVASEYIISDNILVASAIDMVYEGSAPNKVILADIKTTDKLHRRPLYWQLGIYRTLFERQNPGIEVESLFCLHIDKKKRKIRGFYPVDGASESEVDALLDAERNGLIYIDEGAIPEANIVLSDEDIAAYISKQEDIAALKAKMDEIQAGLKFYDEQLLAYMNENNLDELAAPGGVFKRKAAYTRSSIDSARLKKVYPQIAEQFSKTTEVAASLTFKPNK